MSWLQTLKNYFNPPKVEPTFTDLKLKANGAFSIDTTILIAYDEMLLAPIPHDLLGRLTIDAIVSETIWGVSRTMIYAEQVMPETSFSIVLERMDQTSATTLWLQVEQFYPGTTEEWDRFMSEITDKRAPVDTDTQLAYYSDNVRSVTQIGKPPFTNIQHETVWKRDAANGIVELFKIRIVDESVQYWIGYELSPVNVTVIY